MPAHRCERFGRSQAAATEPRVVHEHKMAQGLHCRPLAADALVLRTLGHPAEPLDRRRPAGPQLPESLPQVGRIGRADQQPHWMPPVKLGFDVRRHLDPLTTRLLTSPSMTASCITTPIRRARVKSHSRNSASVRSWASNLAMPGSIDRVPTAASPGCPDSRRHPVRRAVKADRSHHRRHERSPDRAGAVRGQARRTSFRQ